jgi:hypothetical protein
VILWLLKKHVKPELKTENRAYFVKFLQVASKRRWVGRSTVTSNPIRDGQSRRFGRDSQVILEVEAILELIEARSVG